VNTSPDQVDLAAAYIDEDAYTRAPDGTLIAQSSSRAIITTMIRELDVVSGDRILEIGTGSAYSTALLAHLTGPEGHVTTLDVVPELTQRASPLLAAQGYPNTRALTRSGALGAPEHAPYDRVIAWTTPEAIPKTWIDQAADSALLVTPVNITGLSKTYAVVTAKIAHGSLIADTRFTRGAFVEMSDDVVTRWLVPPHGVDALQFDADARPWWLSAFWLRDQPTPELGADLAALLAAECITSGGLLSEAEDAVGFYAWLLAARPAGLTTACLGDPAWQIGHSAPGSAAFIPLAGPGPLSVAGNSSSIDTLVTWADKWRAAGSPGWSALRPETAEDSAADRVVRASMA
jgi:protein-L-isoaspartate(D-aspartate) O-methyltransferase